MRVHKKTPSEAPLQDGIREMVQAQFTTGYESCQSISDIKAELDRLKEIMDNEEYGTTTYYQTVSRYWGIRWTMGWKDVVPE